MQIPSRLPQPLKFLCLHETNKTFTSRIPITMSGQDDLALTELFHDDANVFGRRYSNTVISKPGDLTHDEKFLLRDLFDQFINMPGQDFRACLSPEFYDEFFGHVFKYWVSTHRVNPRPILQPRTPQQTCIEIDPSWAESKPETVKKPTLKRKREPSTFLTMKFNNVEGTFTWTWQTEDRTNIHPNNINTCLPRGVTKNCAMRMAIENYNKFEQRRIYSYNHDQIINAARRRISKWAQLGSSHNDTIDSEDKLEEGDLSRLALASDAYLKIACDVAEIASDLKENRWMVVT